MLSASFTFDQMHNKKYIGILRRFIFINVSLSIVMSIYTPNTINSPLQRNHTAHTISPIIKTTALLIIFSTRRVKISRLKHISLEMLLVQRQRAFGRTCASNIIIHVIPVAHNLRCVLKVYIEKRHLFNVFSHNSPDNQPARNTAVRLALMVNT